LHHKSIPEEDGVGPEHDDMYANIEYAEGTKEDDSVKLMEKNKENGTDGSADEEILLNGTEGRDEQGYKNGERKKGVLRKLNLHKV
jgi:hypothetical protein